MKFVFLLNYVYQFFIYTVIYTIENVKMARRLKKCILSFNNLPEFLPRPLQEILHHHLYLHLDIVGILQKTNYCNDMNGSTLIIYFLNKTSNLN